MPLSCYIPSQIIPKSRVVHLADKQILKRHILSYPKIIVSKNPPPGGRGGGARERGGFRYLAHGLYPLKANFRTAGDQLMGSCRDLTHKILPSVLRVGLDGCQRRLGVAADNNDEGSDWYRADVLQGHRDSQQLSGGDRHCRCE